MDVLETSVRCLWRTHPNLWPAICLRAALPTARPLRKPVASCHTEPVLPLLLQGTVLCDIILLNFLKGADQYKAKKFEEVSWRCGGGARDVEGRGREGH